MDSLRAIAALGVLALHAAAYSHLGDDWEFARPYLARLDVAVPVFFVISGFLLYRPFVAARVKHEQHPATGPYAWRRFLRIVPAYWLALTVTVIWLGLPNVFSPDGVPTYYGLVQIYGDGETARGGIFQTWSLAVEVSFYVFLPLWALLMRRFRARSAQSVLRQEAYGIAALVVVSLVYKVVVLTGAADPDHANTGLSLLYLPAFLDQFAIGMAFAIATVRPAPAAEAEPRRGWIDRFPGLCWLVALVAFVVACAGIGLDGAEGLNEPTTAKQALARHILYGVVALALVAPAVFGDQTRGFLRRHVLANRVLLYLGLVSYGIFLWHTTVLIQLERWDFSPGSALPWFVVALVGTVAIASASYWGLERPILKLKRLFPSRQEQPGEPGPGEPVAPTVPRGAGL